MQNSLAVPHESISLQSPPPWAKFKFKVYKYVIRLRFLIEHMCLTSAWLSEDQTTNTIRRGKTNDTCLKEIRLHSQMLLTTIYSIIMNTIERTYIFS